MDRVSVFDRNAEEYDRWYEDNKRAYQAELDAVRRFIPAKGRGLEIGVGTGRFAGPLGIEVGVDPAAGMLALARERGVETHEGTGENLPFPDASFDYVLMATVDPFVDDLAAVLREAHRVLRNDGRLIVAAINRASPLGEIRNATKADDKFFAQANLRSAEELIGAIRSAGFGTVRTAQTLLGSPEPLVEFDSADISMENDAYEIHDGYGEGAFVVIAAEREPALQIP